MIAAQRRRAILRQVQADGYVEAKRLSADLGVDVSTIRRDLDVLSRAGLVQRTHGGALRSGPSRAVESPLDKGGLDHADERRAIARLAADFVADGASVALDAGSTVYALAQVLATKKDVTIVTNDLHLAHDLAAWRSNRLIVAGGELAESGSVLIGPWALENLAGIHVDWAFLGADAIDPDIGVMTDDISVVPMKRAMIAAARSTAVLADSSRFNRRALAIVARIDEFDRVVTDDGLATDARAAYGPSLVCAVVERSESDAD